MPREADEIVRTQNNFYQIARFSRVIGCVDGTHIKIQSPGGDYGEIYRNRKSYFSINTQIVARPDLMILDIVARWPGSAHDSTIFNSSRHRAHFEGFQFQNAILLGDSGYQMKNYLLTPLLNPVTAAENLYNESHIRTRNVVERLNGVWKRRFSILAYGSRCRIYNVLAMIVASAVLQNIAVDMSEDLPPLPNELNGEELEYLIMQGDIAYIPMANLVHGPIYFRQNLIHNYLANL